MHILGIDASAANHPYWMEMLASNPSTRYLTKSSTGDVYLGLDSSGNSVKLNSLGALQWQKTNAITLAGTAVDSSDNLYTVGNASGPTPHLVKSDSSGTILWQRKVTSAVSYSAVGTDSSGNVYAGTTEGTLIKYNSSGTIQWQRKLASTAYNAIAIDSSGNVYATGYSVVGSRSDIQLVKYNSSGTIQWQTALSTGYASTNTRGYDLKLDSSGNPHIAAIAVVGGYNYMYVIKLNTSGVVQWQRYMTTLSGGAYGIAIDSSSNVYVTGFSKPFGDSVGLIFKYDSSGTIQWKRQVYTIVSSVVYGTMFSIAVGSNNEFYATGYTRVDASNYNGITLKLPTDGSLTGARTVGGFSVTYSVSSLSEAAGSLTNTTSTFAESAGTLTDAAGALTTSNTSYTSSVTSI